MRSDVHGTPILFINGDRHEGQPRPDAVYRAILRQIGGELARRRSFLDDADEASAESFAASDPPGWIPRSPEAVNDIETPSAQ